MAEIFNVNMRNPYEKVIIPLCFVTIEVVEYRNGSRLERRFCYGYEAEDFGNSCVGNAGISDGIGDYDVCIYPVFFLEKMKVT